MPGEGSALTPSVLISCFLLLLFTVSADCPGCDNGICNKPNQCRYLWYIETITIRHTLYTIQSYDKGYIILKLNFLKYKYFDIDQWSHIIYFRCFNGWMGSNCTECKSLPGCKHGKCIDQPNSCICDQGWEGHLCDEPVCE